MTLKKTPEVQWVQIIGMAKSLFPKYANITTWAIETFKSFYLECQRKKKRTVAAEVVVQPIITSEV